MPVTIVPLLWYFTQYTILVVSDFILYNSMFYFQKPTYWFTDVLVRTGEVTAGAEGRFGVHTGSFTQLVV